jgi:hypothetical protein
MTLDEKEIALLRKTYEIGNKAEAVKDVISAVCDSIIERCKNEFSTTPINCYQNIDNNPIIMLQLKIATARSFKTAVESAILAGKEAGSKLKMEAHR